MSRHSEAIERLKLVIVSDWEEIDVSAFIEPTCFLRKLDITELLEYIGDLEMALDMALNPAEVTHDDLIWAYELSQKIKGETSHADE